MGYEEVSCCDCVKAITQVHVKLIISVRAVSGHEQSISQVARAEEQDLNYNRILLIHNFMLYLLCILRN